MTIDNKQLRESIWDLVYGLLSDEESQALIARIKSDPDAARLYADVRLEADLVAQAARVEDSSLSLKGGEEGTVAAKAQTKTARAGSGRFGTDLHRGAGWLAGLAATALAALLIVGISWPRPDPRLFASGLVAAELVASQPLVAGLTCPAELRTYQLDPSGKPADGAPANVEVRLLDRAGNARFKQAVQTNEIGRATLNLPGNALEPGVRLEIAATKQSQASADSPSDRIANSAAGAAEESNAVAAELPVQPEPQIAYFLTAAPAPPGDQQVPYAEWNFSAFTAKPESAQVVQNAMPSIRGGGAIPGEARAAQLSDPAAANGALQFQDLQKINTPLRALNERSAGAVVANDLKAQAVVPPNQPITVDVPEQLEGKPLRVAAMNRGVTVANQIVTRAPGKERKGRAQSPAGNKEQGLAEQLSLALPPEADGLVEVQLFDESKNQDEPVDRQYVVRQPARRLQIDVPNARSRYLPGEEVALTLQCTDESGKPAADTRLGVRVWNEGAIKQSGEEPVLLADAVDHGLGDVVQETLAPEPQAASERGQAGRLDNYAAAPTASGQPIELATNRDAVKTALAAALEQAESARQQAIVALGSAAIIGGIAVLLLLAMLAVRRLSIGWRAMAPGFAVAIASLLIGLGWVGWLPEGRFAGGIAMSRATPAASTATGDSSAATQKPAGTREREDAPAADSRLAEHAKSESAPAEAPALASSPAPPPSAMPKPTSSLARSSAPADKELTRAEAGAAPATAPLTQKFEQARAPIVTLQVPRGQQSRAFNLAKDAEVESTARPSAGAAGAPGGFVGGRAIASAPAGAPADQLKRKSNEDESKKEPLAELAAGKPQSAAAPASLYFNPELMTDAQGKATVRFTMPQTDSEYRVLVDALGQGRIGSRQQTIICGEAPSK